MSKEMAKKQDGSAQPLDPEVQHHLGAQLQATFADVEKGPLPDDHVELLLALRRNERELQRGRC